jgi:hypothetical protein
MRVTSRSPESRLVAAPPNSALHWPGIRCAPSPPVSAYVRRRRGRRRRPGAADHDRALAPGHAHGRQRQRPADEDDQPDAGLDVVRHHGRGRALRGARAGLDVARVPQVLSGGYADSLLLQRVWPKIVARDFVPPAATPGAAALPAARRARPRRHRHVGRVQALRRGRCLTPCTGTPFDPSPPIGLSGSRASASTDRIEREENI